MYIYEANINASNEQISHTLTPIIKCVYIEYYQKLNFDHLNLYFTNRNMTQLVWADLCEFSGFDQNPQAVS